MKPTLVFLHGFPLNSKMWENQVSYFDTYNVFTPNLSGSETPPSTFFSLDEVAKTVASEIISNHESSILIGLSMGGYVAQRILELNPHTFLGLVLISTRSSADTNAAKLKRVKAMEDIKANGLDGFIQEFTKNLVSQKTLENPSLFQKILSIAKENKREGILSQILALMGRVDSENFLPKISIPTLIISGSEDTLSPPNEMKEIFQKIPNHEFKIVENSGHLSPMENPDSVNLFINNFLQKFL
jgi:pimeloyl-ACP methyl ester carboxylesterase